MLGPHPHPSPACSPQSCWVWAPGCGCPGVTKADPEGRGSVRGCAGGSAFEDPEGRGGAGPVTLPRGGRAAMATESGVTACVSCQEHPHPTYNRASSQTTLPPAHPPETTASSQGGEEGVLVPLGGPGWDGRGASGRASLDLPARCCPAEPMACSTSLLMLPPDLLLEDLPVHTGAKGPQVCGPFLKAALAPGGRGGPQPQEAGEGHSIPGTAARAPRTCSWRKTPRFPGATPETAHPQAGPPGQA